MSGGGREGTRADPAGPCGPQEDFGFHSEIGSLGEM